MRRQITLLVAATTSIVLLAFLLPAAALVARVAEGRALDTARAQLQLLIPVVGLDERAEVAAGLPVADLTVDPRSRRVTLAGTPVELSPKEFDLLAYLAARAGAVVPKRELLTEVWQQPYGGSDKTVDVHLSWLRRKLGEDGARLLQTVRGVGVRLAEPGP